jgi:hypothetical protein
MYPISMRGFAEVSSAAPEKKAAKLREYKFKKSGESKGRSNYYVKALSAIRHHHHGNTANLNQIMQDLAQASVGAQTGRARGKAVNNLLAISAYLQKHGKRKLTILKGKRLYFLHQNLVISAQPDLIVEENGHMRLIKFNFGKGDHSGAVVAVMLHILYEAATNSGLKIGSDQVECIQVISESRIVGPKGGFGPAMTLKGMADEIISLWPSIA